MDSESKEKKNIKIKVTRAITLPDPVRLARYKKVPEYGPRILFFSGGSALRKLSQKLVDYTHNSIHLITPFDSGGSSATLRKAFHMLAVGDVRNRLMALADQSVHGNPDIYDLFAYRFPKDADPQQLYHDLENIILKRNSLIKKIPNPMRKIIRNHLRYFITNMPDDFDLRGASIGNLILVGGYLNNQHHIDPVIYLFSKLVEVKGIVRPVVNTYLHLVAELENGEELVEQHNFTGKETNPISSPIKKLFLTKNLGTVEAVEIQIRQKIVKLIHSSEIICYPIGSFFSSLIATLLPKGVGQAISENDCPKVYIPNRGKDPEQLGMTLADSVKTLIDYLHKSCYEVVPVSKLLNFVLIDSSHGFEISEEEIKTIHDLGVEVIDISLISESTLPYYDEDKLISVLLSLV